MTDDAKRCAVLIINPRGAPSPYRTTLETLGFLVKETRDWPDDDRTVLDYHVVIVEVTNIDMAPMIAARVRAKPRFGRRVLVALVPGSASLAERIAARTSGFDDVLVDCCDARQLVARILKQLRARPEFHCILPPADKRRSAA